MSRRNSGSDPRNAHTIADPRIPLMNGGGTAPPAEEDFRRRSLSERVGTPPPRETDLFSAPSATAVKEEDQEEYYKRRWMEAEAKLRELTKYAGDSQYSNNQGSVDTDKGITIFLRYIGEVQFEGMTVLRLQERVSRIAEISGVVDHPDFGRKLCSALQREPAERIFGSRLWRGLQNSKTLADFMDLTSRADIIAECRDNFEVHCQTIWIEAQTDHALITNDRRWHGFLARNNETLQSISHPKAIAGISNKFFAESILMKLLPLGRWQQLCHFVSARQGNFIATIDWPEPRQLIELLEQLPEIPNDSQWIDNIPVELRKAINEASKVLYFAHRGDKPVSSGPAPPPGPNPSKRAKVESIRGGRKPRGGRPFSP